MQTIVRTRQCVLGFIFVAGMMLMSSAAPAMAVTPAALLADAGDTVSASPETVKTSTVAKAADDDMRVTDLSPVVAKNDQFMTP